MIPIRNIYYMLSYAFRILNEHGYESLAVENFDNSLELCAEILIRGISIQLKRGLDREYIPKTDPMSSIKGKIDISETIKTQLIFKKTLVCSYDDFSVNSYMNKIIKTTLMLLLKSDISKTQKKKIRKLLMFFIDVDELNLYDINWNFHFHKNNQTYRMLIYVCNLIIKGLIQTRYNGTEKMMGFIDEQSMHRLYEKFVLEYYRREHPEIHVSASQIPWQLDDDEAYMLPTMQSDIMLAMENVTLIIDAKYYSRTMQTRDDIRKIHSGNLYQIFTYVKNKDLQFTNQSHKVSGMLLYAKTDESIVPNNSYSMSGNKISVKTLDLNCDFSEISRQLDDIVYEHF